QIDRSMHEQRGMLDQLTRDVAHINNRFAARPYMAKDIFGAAGDLMEPMGYASDAALLVNSPATPPSFADLFRGPESLITERQRLYLPFFQGLTQVVDLGCGRGEFLRLLAGIGIRATGVETNRLLVEALTSQGLAVVEADALQYLRDLPPGSLDAI